METFILNISLTIIHFNNYRTAMTLVKTGPSVVHIAIALVARVTVIIPIRYSFQEAEFAGISYCAKYPP